MTNEFFRNKDGSITVDGIRYIPDKQINSKSIESEENRSTGIEEPKQGEYIFFINDDDFCCEEKYSLVYKNDYIRGRITTNKQIAIDRDKASRIRFALERYASEHNKEVIDWTDKSEKFHIVYNMHSDELYIMMDSFFKDSNTIYFASEGIAWKAIDEVGKNDVLWLYRDYQPYLNAYKLN